MIVVDCTFCKLCVFSEMCNYTVLIKIAKPYQTLKFFIKIFCCVIRFKRIDMLECDIKKSESNLCIKMP